MRYQSRPKWPDISFPVERGRERYEVLKKLLPIAEKMKAFGVRVDMARVETHIQEALVRAETMKRKFLDLTGLKESDLGKAGAGQTDAVRDYFWVTLKAPPVIFHKRTKKPQFNTPTLVSYAEDFDVEPLRSAAAALYGLRAARTALRFANTYRAVASRHDGRIHFGFNPLGTKGTRWSASASWRFFEQETLEWVEYSLNAQNIPSRPKYFKFPGDAKPTLLAVGMRDCFIPDEGCVFFKADGDNQEVRIITYNSGGKTLQSWLDNGVDCHTANAAGLWPDQGLPKAPTKAWVEANDKWVSEQGFSLKTLRTAAKPSMYGLTYQAPSENRHGQERYPQTYAQLKTTFPDMEESDVNILADRLFKMHPEIRQMQRGMIQEVKDTGKIVLPQTGDQLYLPSTQRGYNQAINFRHQSAGHAGVNLAIIEIWDRLGDPVPGGSAMMLDCHDEVAGQILDTPEEIAHVTEVVETAMGRPQNFGSVVAGIPAQVHLGKNWGACK